MHPLFHLKNSDLFLYLKEIYFGIKNKSNLFLFMENIFEEKI